MTDASTPTPSDSPVTLELAHAEWKAWDALVRERGERAKEARERHDEAIEVRDRWAQAVRALNFEAVVSGGTEPRQCPHGFHHPAGPHSCDGCWCEGERDRREYGWPHDTSPKAGD